MRTLGFPRSFANDVQIQSYPAFSIAGLAGVGSSASAGQSFGGMNSWGQRGSLTWVKGAHTLKFGGDYRIQQMNQFPGELTSA